MNQLVKSVECLVSSIANIKQVIVAYSGGVDSHVLIHACSVLQHKMPAVLFKSVYIDHGLHESSDRWRNHCQAVSTNLGIKFSTTKVDARDVRGDGPEQAARHARYDALSEYVDSSTVLLTAQHQDDQAETLLLQLLRGAGVKGLSSMPRVNSFAGGVIARPLLEFSKQDILTYAKSAGLEWVDDPSNLDQSLNRNFLRQQVIPLIEQRWPSFAVTTARTAAHCAEASSILSNYASSYLLETDSDVLAVATLETLDDETQRAVLREWLIANEVRLPSQKVLRQIQSFIVMDSGDSALVEWGGHQVRTFDGKFMLLKKAILPTGYGVLPWKGEELVLPEPLGCLSINQSTGQGIKKTFWEQSDITIRSRIGGEVISLLGRHGTKKLKKLFHEYKAFPWVRQLIPLVYAGETLVAIADIWIAKDYLAAEGELGYEIDWHHPNFRIKY